MEENLYDEFGNYIGPELDEEEAPQVAPSEEMRYSPPASPSKEEASNDRAMVERDEMGNLNLLCQLGAENAVILQNIGIFTNNMTVDFVQWFQNKVNKGSLGFGGWRFLQELATLRIKI